MPNLRDARYLLIQIWTLGTANCLKIILVFNSFENLVSIKCSFKWLYLKFIPFIQTWKNKVYNSDKRKRYTWKICGRHIWPNLAGQISPCLIENPRGRRFWVFLSFQIRSSSNDLISEFLNIKSLHRDHTGANVSLAKFQSRSNVK